MLELSLAWLLGGIIVGVLALAAGVAPMALWPGMRPRRLAVCVVGALAALAGGWLGTALWGRFFGSPAALWISVLVVVVVPWALGRRARHAALNAGVPASRRARQG